MFENWFALVFNGSILSFMLWVVILIGGYYLNRILIFRTIIKTKKFPESYYKIKKGFVTKCYGLLLVGFIFHDITFVVLCVIAGCISLYGTMDAESDALDFKEYLEKLNNFSK